MTASEKYDRQIRIWGEAGQLALERASVCVVNAGPTGTETLKNLVLPGIGSFTLIDGSDVAKSDVGNNFFLAEADLPPGENAMSKAATAARMLTDLNDQVYGSYIRENPERFLSSKEDAAWFFRDFSIVILTQAGIDEPLTRIIAAGCYEAAVPFMLVRSYGLVGYVRVQIPEMCVMNAREEGTPPDLRICDPFPSLCDFVDSVDLASIRDCTVASHVPLVVILMKALAKFRVSYGSKTPSTRDEKNTLKSIVQSLCPPCCKELPENFQEALKPTNLRLCCADAAHEFDNIRQIFQTATSDLRLNMSSKVSKPSSNVSPEVVHLSLRAVRQGAGASSPDEDKAEQQIANPVLNVSDRHANVSFWTHVAAVQTYVEQNGGRLPVSGTLPDMTADTVSYVNLQRLYSHQAKSDATEVLKYAKELSDQQNIPHLVNETTVSDFCRHLRGIRVLRYRSIEDEVCSVPGSEFLNSMDLNHAVDSTESTTTLAYVLLRAADKFMIEHGWYPGEKEGLEESDLRLLRDNITGLRGCFGGSIPQSCFDGAEEFTRFANGELHNVAAFMGGVAAQEAAKIITRQFLPLNNTLIVNFATMTSTSFVA